MENLDLLGHDLQVIKEKYQRLPADKKLNGLSKSNEFLLKFIGAMDDFVNVTDYINRETHYALSNAGYAFSNETGFVGINHEQYLRVRDKVLECLTYQGMRALHMGGKIWWASIMVGLDSIFGRTPEEKNRAVRELVSSS